ncbi:MAG: hypothetical protein ABIP69_05885 [Ferruginibacter sp.]
MNKAIFVFLCLLSFQGFSQKTPDKITKGTPFKVPLLYTTINNLNSKSFLSQDEAGKVLNMPLEVKDDKKGDYTIASYLIAYYKVSQKQDEVTGKAVKVVNLVSQRFTSTPIPGIFLNPLIGHFTSGEEIMFLDIIVKDSKGRVMYAPDLKLTIK